MIRPIIAACLTLAATSLFSLQAHGQASAVVELFTSQGCSSCPPADAFLDELAEREKVIALSYHVDYWDYLGWKDTFGSPEHSERQRAYADRRGDRRVYTPQMIVNGGDHLVGSDRLAVEEAIEDASLPLDVELAREGGRIVARIGGSGRRRGEATLWFAEVVRTAEVEIERGENRGEVIRYRNIVTELHPIGMWDGQPMTIELPADEVADANRGCAVLVQVDRDGKPGTILGGDIYFPNAKS